ncbi:prepilin peptidase [Pediococcus argentinicus]|uniref:Prepilin peptidase A24 N-terminal domain-containing protein n=1 Tax=Pediococcus argentinicus TaxID=480391 RepID=A0A0R2NNK9_9LACO|nr:hypothetical protein IV88_GL000766 [Pediococcus argentinicus]NKZ22763.1 prepilin peptidase [Pediococcus argentinicus]
MIQLYLFIIGSCIGSFLVASYQRLSQGKSIYSPRSHCDSCQTLLPIFLLIPIASYLLCLGKCVYCRAKIPIYTLLIELICALLFLSVYVRFPRHILYYLLLFTILLFISTEDLATKSISTNCLLYLTGLLFFHKPTLIGFILLCLIILLSIEAFDFQRYFRRIGLADIELILSFMIVLNLERVSYIVLCATLIIFPFHISFKHKPLPFIPALSLFFILLCK